MATERIALGSGYIYVSEFSDTIPENSVLETDENNIGYIQGGASIEYTPEFYEAKDDMGKVAKKIITDEEAILKSGFMTWNGKTLGVLCSTARVTEDASKKTRTVKIGGIGNYDDKKYVVRFVHADKKTRLTIVGSNNSGLEIAFAKDKETVLNAEFKAMPNDDDGTLIIYEESDDTIAVNSPVQGGE